jgi:ubiquinone/menaquinone biosynthesis C-methylase UbiE
MPTEARYIHALRFSALTALYDPVVALTTREREFKQQLVDGVPLKARQKVLDVGCGTGTLACMLAQAEPKAKVHGLDGDQEILRRARDKAAAHQLKIRFTHGLSFALPYPDGHFDQVLSSLFFHHLRRDDKLKTLREIRRVLKPGGGLHVADWGQAQDPLMRGLFLGIQFLDGFASTADNVAGRLPGLISQAGFARVEVETRLRTLFGSMEIIRAGPA